VFPNPACEQISVNNPISVNADKYSMRDMLGQLVTEGSLTAGKNNIKISDMAPGSYIISVYKSGKESGNHIFSKL
jgi:hypothetical protein